MPVSAPIVLRVVEGDEEAVRKEEGSQETGTMAGGDMCSSAQERGDAELQAMEKAGAGEPAASVAASTDVAGLTWAEVEDAEKLPATASVMPCLTEEAVPDIPKALQSMR